MSRNETQPPVLITGIGHVVHPAFSEALAGARCAPPDTPEITGFEVHEDAPASGWEVRDFEVEEHFPNIKPFMDRTSAFAMAAAQAALKDAGLLDPDRRPAGCDIGCAYGTTMGCLEAMEIFWKKLKKGNPKFAPPLPFTHSYTNSPSSLLCIEFGLKGSAATFSGESLVGVEAVVFALDQLRSGAAHAILVCASESLSAALHAHLLAEGRLSPSGRLNPWGTGNDGMTPGEGGVCVLLETAESAASGGRAGYARIDDAGLGSGSESDRHDEAWRRAGDQALGDLAVLAASTVVIPSGSGDDARDATEAAFWRDRIGTDDPATLQSPKLLCGDLMSASPLLAVALAAELLRRPDSAIPPVFARSDSARPAPELLSRIFIGESDPNCTAGIIAVSRA